MCRDGTEELSPNSSPATTHTHTLLQCFSNWIISLERTLNIVEGGEIRRRGKDASTTFGETSKDHKTVFH